LYNEQVLGRIALAGVLCACASLAAAACGIGLEGAAPGTSAEGGPPSPSSSRGDDASPPDSPGADADTDADTDATVPDGGADAGPSAITFVRSAHTNYIAATTTSVALTVTAGDALVVATYVTGTQTMAVSDTLGNTWTSAALTTGTSCSTTVAQLWYALDAKGGADTFTVSVGSSTDIGITAAEYSGVATANALDAKSAAVATGSSNAMSAPSLTTTGALDVIVALFQDAAGGGTMVPGTGYTARERDVGFYTILEDDLPGVAPGTHAVTATLPSTKNDACWGASAIALVAR
jgi:hypothetical protein